jgi:signal transduction histidine kinase
VVESTIGDARVSPERFEAALDCLVENAVKFTRPGDRIEVAGWRQLNGWFVQVNDAGSGISPDVVQRLLTSPPGEGTPTGTGLGLAIVRAVVEALGGQITINGATGGGTTITLFVPQRPLEPRDLSREPSLNEPGSTHSEMVQQLGKPL